MVTDQELLQAISQDPFHQAMHQATLAGPQPCPFAVADMLEQLFPSAALELPSIWASKPTRTKATATFARSSSQPRE